MADKFIICMKWGPDFPADYVNVLYGACADHMAGDFRFICLTDKAEGLHPQIEAMAIPDIGLTPAQWYTSGVWPKLALFAENLHGLQGRALFIDLDMMIMGPLDPFFEMDGAFIALDVGPNWRPKGGGHPQETGTGVFAFDIGAQAQILEAFVADRDAALAQFQNEQDFVGAHVQGQMFWPEDWVLSFKRHVARRLGRDLLMPPKPPHDAPIIAFHGTPRPIDLLEQGIWGRFPHQGRGPVPWVKAYWDRYNRAA